MGFHRFLLEFDGIVLGKKVGAVVNDVMQQKKPVHFFQAANLRFVQGVMAMVRLEKQNKPIFSQRANVVGKSRPISPIRNDPAKEIKVQHAIADPKPVVVPPGK